MGKVVVYSAIVGDIDLPRDDVLCFTDGFEDRFSDPRLAAKMYKVLPHHFLPEDTQWSIWVDGNITLNVSPGWLIKQTYPREIGVFKHGERQCLYEEGRFCKKIGKGNPGKIDEQLIRYKEMGFPKDSGLWFCGVLVRKHTERIRRLNEEWWGHICRYSQRDQISFPVVFNGMMKTLPTVPMHDNKYFKRPKHGKRL
jgi:hypothetical protein